MEDKEIREEDVGYRKIIGRKGREIERRKRLGRKIKRGERGRWRVVEVEKEREVEG